MVRHRMIITAGIAIALSGLTLTPLRTPAAPGKEKKPSVQVETTAPGVIKSESDIVLVNVIVTDKQGRYLQDMKQQEFHVFEDGKEQPITSFSREAGNHPGAPGNGVSEREGNMAIRPAAPVRPQYVLLFFDCASLLPDNQLYERDQATRFVESTASTNRRIAVINFDGTAHLDQNFTADKELLKRAVSRIKLGSSKNDSEPRIAANPTRAPSRKNRKSTSSI